MQQRMHNEEKAKKYLSWLQDRTKLVQASRVLIRRKKSPLARLIANGNLKAMKKAAEERLRSMMSSEERKKLCKVICDLRNHPNGKGRQATLAAAAGALLMFVTEMTKEIAGLTVLVAWLFAAELSLMFCKCRFDRTCHGGSCDDNLLPAA